MELQLVDGAPAVKSRSMNLWPIQCFRVVLPPKLRDCFSNKLSWFVVSLALQKSQI